MKTTAKHLQKFLKQETLSQVGLNSENPGIVYDIRRSEENTISVSITLTGSYPTKELTTPASPINITKKGYPEKKIVIELIMETAGENELKQKSS